MPSSKRQKELARRRAERQAARRAAERARRRKRRVVMGGVIAGVAAVIVLTLAIVAATRDDKKDSVAEPSASATPTAEPTVACGAKKPAAPNGKQWDKEPKLTVDEAKTYTATLQTSCGAISWTMDAGKAPHTVNSFAFLAKEKFYNGTFCHRMTNSPGLIVLQCGDPEGTGGGGPGYTLAEENLKGAKYTRGTVAMAKASAPHSTGSQFFLVDKDSQLPAEYTVVGQMDAASLKVLDKILAIGIENEASDGAPKQRVYVEDFAVATK